MLSCAAALAFQLADELGTSSTTPVASLAQIFAFLLTTDQFRQQQHEPGQRDLGQVFMMLLHYLAQHVSSKQFRFAEAVLISSKHYLVSFPHLCKQALKIEQLYEGDLVLVTVLLDALAAAKVAAQSSATFCSNSTSSRSNSCSNSLQQSSQATGQHRVVSHRPFDPDGFEGCLLDLRPGYEHPEFPAHELWELGPMMNTGGCALIYDIIAVHDRTVAAGVQQPQPEEVLAKLFISREGYVDPASSHKELRVTWRLRGTRGVLQCLGAGRLLPGNCSDTTIRQLVSEEEVLVMLMPRYKCSLGQRLKDGPLHPVLLLTVSKKMLKVIKALQSRAELVLNR